MPWHPDIYDRFKAQRDAPFNDLIALIDPRSAMRVIDLGCGTGELTARLTDLLHDSEVTGIDSSATMIARARGRVRPGLQFERAAIQDVHGEWDLVFSHAALQWLDDHQTVIPRVLSLVAPGGQFAAVIASDHAIAARVILRATAAEEPFCSALDGWQRHVELLPLERYAELALAHGAETLTVFEKLYPVMLPNVDALAAWYHGTALIPYLERLPDEQHAPFLNRYRDNLAVRWPSGPVLYPGNRIIIAARMKHRKDAQ